MLYLGCAASIKPVEMIENSIIKSGGFAVIFERSCRENGDLKAQFFIARKPVFRPVFERADEKRLEYPKTRLRPVLFFEESPENQQLDPGLGGASHAVSH